MTMIKVTDLTMDEMIDLYAWMKKGLKEREIGQNAYDAVVKLITEEIRRRHKESPAW